MTEPLTAVTEALLTAGPVAIVLGVCVYTLWKALQREREAKEKLYTEVMTLLRRIAGVNGSHKDESAP